MHGTEAVQSTLQPLGVSSSEPIIASSNSREQGSLRKVRGSGDSIPRSIVKKSSPIPPKITCLCAPTTHAGSFRCRFHRGITRHSSVRAPLAPASNIAAAPLDKATTLSSTSTIPAVGPAYRASSRFASTCSNKNLRSFQAQPSCLSRMIVASSPSDAAAAITMETPSIAEDSHRSNSERSTEHGNNVHTAIVDVSSRKS